MFLTLLVLVLFSSFEDSNAKKVKDPNRIRTLINLINKYTKDHGEALKELSLNEIRKQTGYVAYGYNRSVDYNLIPHMVSTFFDTNKFLTAIILGVNHNGTTPWTTTTANVIWRRKWKDVNIPTNVHGESDSMSISKSVEDSKSNERWIPNGRRYFDSEEFVLLKTTKDPFEDATPFKLNYEEIHLKNNERDINNGKNWGRDKDSKGRGSSENVPKDKSDDWNKPNRKEEDNWDKPLKSGNGWDEKHETLKRDRYKSSSNLERKTKDSRAIEFANQFPSKTIKESLEYYKRKKTKKPDYSEYGDEKNVAKDTNGVFRMKAKNWDRPIKNDDFGKSKDDNSKPMKIAWYTKKDDDWNKKEKNDWDKLLKDSWETKKDENWNKKARDDWNKPLKDSWDPKKEKYLDKQSNDDWDTPKKVDWDTPKKDDWGEAKETKEWKRPPKPKVADLMNERHYPTYDERPRHGKRNRAAGGYGRTSIPFIGKRGIYEEK